MKMRSRACHEGRREGHLALHTENRAGLIVVDVQIDFCQGGALGVPGGEEVVPVLNRWIRRFAHLGLPIAFTFDWHPADHCSFKERGGIWPVHCVQGEDGSSLRPDLELPSNTAYNSGTAPSTTWAVFKKGFLTGCEAYSGFDGRLEGIQEGPTLGEWLREQGVGRLYVGGLATEYCVKATVQDGLNQGFRVSIIREGMRAVEVNPGDGARAIDEMLRAGAQIAGGPDEVTGD